MGKPALPLAKEIPQRSRLQGQDESTELAIHVDLVYESRKWSRKGAARQETVNLHLLLKVVIAAVAMEQLQRKHLVGVLVLDFVHVSESALPQQVFQSVTADRYADIVACLLVATQTRRQLRLLLKPVVVVECWRLWIAMATMNPCMLQAGPLRAELFGGAAPVLLAFRLV